MKKDVILVHVGVCPCSDHWHCSLDFGGVAKDEPHSHCPHHHPRRAEAEVCADEALRDLVVECGAIDPSSN